MNTLTRLTKLSSIAIAIALSGAACGDLDSSDPAAGDPTTDPTTEVQSALFYGYQDVGNPPVWTQYTVGMALAKDTTTYTWYDDGWVCEGIGSHLCTAFQYEYSAPLNRWADVRGIAMNHKNYVYAWYRDKTYSIGDPGNLTSRTTQRNFTTFHRMDDLVDVFSITYTVPILGQTYTRWYYYWKMYSPTSPDRVVYMRTVGTESNAEYYEDEREVTVSRVHGDVVGIDYNQETGRIWTWYSDGQRNSSTSTLNLAFN